MRWMAALVTTVMLWSASAFAFDFNSSYYAVYELSGPNNTKYIYIVPKNSFLILGVEQPTPIMFMPQTTGFFAILAGDGTLGAFQKTNLTANNLPVGAITSSYKLFGGDFDGNGAQDFLIQGTGARYSYVLNNDASGNAQIYYSFGTELGSNTYPQISVIDVDQNGRADIVATNASGNTTTYFSSSYGQWFNTASTGSSGSTTNVNLIGSINGKFRVDESGEATYGIDILSAAGTAGVAPHLSLNYSSGAGEGIAGQGWSVSGLSGISRCRQTLAQDNNVTAITLGASDRFCLDGQRLILVGGTYGAPDSTYRTEIDSYALITAKGGSVGNPAYFTVQRKDGSTSYYGNGNGSAVVLNGSGPILSWGISRFQDSAGNPIRFSYTTNTTTNEQQINRIDFAYGSDKTATSNSSTYIQFVYEARPDVSSGYVTNYLMQRTQRLAKIVSYSSGTELRSYSLVYRPAGLVNGRSVPEKIFECVGTNCLSPTQFAWTASQSGFEAGTVVRAIANWDPVRIIPADLNGDNKQDLIYIVKPNDYARAYYLLATSSGFSAPVYLRDVDSASSNIVVSDLNNDGKQDVLIGRKNQNWFVAYGHAYGLTVPADLQIPYDINAQFLDINGDGLSDAIYPSSANPATLRYRTLQRIKTGNSGSYQWTYQFGAESTAAINFAGGTPVTFGVVTASTTAKPIAADFNGDGRVDVLGKLTYNFNCPPYGCSAKVVTALNASSNGTFNSAQSLPWGDADLEKAVRVIDLNSDGLADVIVKRNDSWQVYLNTGTAFVAGAVIGAVPNDFSMQFVDFNQDGYADLIYAASGALQVRYFMPGTNAFAPAVSTGFSIGNANYEQYLFADADGDGHIDLFRTVYDDNISTVYLHKSKNAGSVRQRITSIDNGFGNVTDITYKPLTDSTVYTKRSDANDATVWPEAVPPVFDLAVPNYVVASVSSTAPAANATLPSSVSYGAKSSVSYQYAGLKVQASGRGVLGFSALTTIDNQTGVKTTTTYRQDYPFIGQPLSTIVQSGSGAVLKLSTNTPTAKTLSALDGTRYYQIYISQVTEQQWDPSTLAETGYLVTTTSGLDDWGNVASTTATAYAVPSHSNYLTRKTTTNTYGTSPSDTYGKQFGRLSKSVVEHERAGGTKLIRTSDFTYYDSSAGDLRGLLKSEAVTGSTAAGATLSSTSTYYQYDSFGNKTCASTGSDNSTSNCAAGTANRYTKTAYDSTGRFAASSASLFYNGSGWAEQTTEQILARNTYGQPLQVQGLNGVIANYTYDALGRESSRSDNTGASLTTAYARYGVTGAQYNVTTRASTGATATQYFDALGRVIVKTQVGFDGRTISTETEYDNIGRVKRESLPHFSGDTVYWATNTYDNFRLLNQQAPATGGSMATTTLNYDVVNDSGVNLVRITTTNALGQTRKELRNPAGELVKVEDYLGGLIQYTYDAAGQLIQTTNTTYVGGTPYVSNTYIDYDLLGRKNKMRDPEKGNWYYQYNGFGELVDQYKVMQDPSNITGIGDLATALANSTVKMQRTHMDYDRRGRMNARMDYRDDGSQEGGSTWIYDTATNGVGQLAQESGGGLTRNYSYDSKGRPVSTLHNDGNGAYLLTVSYDSFGRPSQQTDALGTGSGTQTTYNNYGYPLSTIDLATNTVISQVQAMDARGNVLQAVLGNGATSTWTYDAGSGLLLIQKATTVGGVVLQNLTYTWDALGNQTSRRDQGILSTANNTYKDLKQNFCYDGLNRLIKTHENSLNGSCSMTGAQQDQEYDGFGNITRKNNIGAYTYNSAKLRQLQSTGDGVGYTYDAVGNLTSDTSGRTLRYTVFDKPYEITKGSNTNTFTYGADRNYYKRVDIGSNGTATTYQIGGVEKVIKPDGSYDIKRYLGGVALWSHHFAANGTSTGIDKQYTYKDVLGSVTLITDHVGTVKQQLAFNAWGQRVDTNNWQTVLPSTTFLPVSQQFTTVGYTGQDMLDAVGLIHYGGRIYDPKLARFVQADPFVQDGMDLQAYNRYAYVRNNPLTLTDPSGFSWLSKTWKKIKHAVKNPFQSPREMVRDLDPAANWLADNTGDKWLKNSETLRTIGAVVMSVVDYYYCGGSGACVGAYNAYVTELMGGSVLQQASAFAFSYASAQGAQWIGANVQNPILNVAAHGTMGGVMSELQGGSFGNGFAAAGLSAAVGYGMDKYGWKGTSTPDVIGRTAVAAVVGGTASQMTGGKFANGAITAAFVHVFNWESHLWMRASPAQADAAYAMQSPEVQAAVAQDQLNRAVTGTSNTLNYIGLGLDMGALFFPPAAPVLTPLSVGVMGASILIDNSYAPLVQTTTSTYIDRAAQKTPLPSWAKSRVGAGAAVIMDVHQLIKAD